MNSVQKVMRQLPLGIQDFKVIRDNGYYFVDKSMLIGQILDHVCNGVYLYTRPRRFGKSLNLSMNDAYFNLKYKDNTWFDDLEISKHHCYDVYKNAFPVVFVDLRCDNVQNIDNFIYKMKCKMSEVYDEFAYLLDSSELSVVDKDYFNTVFWKKGNAIDLANALKMLCRMLEKHHKKKVVVLIDEYDNTINSLDDLILRDKIIQFLREMNPLLKGNTSLQMGVVTGIMQIVKEDIYSDLNNLIVNNMFSRRFDEMFGFTGDEVEQMCADYGHPEKYPEAKEWYDGYRFGEVDIYNPWSVINYISEGFTPASYWVNTSGNTIIGNLLSRADNQVFEDLCILGSGRSISHDISALITSGDLNQDPNALYSIMVLSGYLKAVPEDGHYVLSMPNRELYDVFAQMIIRFVLNVRDAEDHFRTFCNAVLSNDVLAMEKSLYALITDTLSVRVLDNEHSYQAFIAGILTSLSGRYEVTADFENGKGYYDIVMRSKSGEGINAVMELKRSATNQSLECDARRAILQIRERDYARGLKGQTVLFGIAFHGKEPEIVSEML